MDNNKTNKFYNLEMWDGSTRIGLLVTNRKISYIRRMANDIRNSKSFPKGFQLIPVRIDDLVRLIRYN